MNRLLPSTALLFFVVLLVGNTSPGRTTEAQHSSGSVSSCVPGVHNCSPLKAQAGPLRAPTLNAASINKLKPGSSEIDTSGRVRKESGGGSGVPYVSQGATLLLIWYCVDQYGNLCPLNVVANWTGYAPPGISAAFNPTSTIGGGAAVEAFTVQQNTPVGTYGVNACLTITGLVGQACQSFLINVVSSYIQQQPVPVAPAPGVTLKLQLASAKFPLFNFQVLNFGHLYITSYINGVPTNIYQAGPGLAPNGDLDLLVESYNQFPLADPGIDITSSIKIWNVINESNKYLGWQHSNQTPNYLINMNSNTFITGILLSNGIPQSTVYGWVNSLASQLNYNPVGYNNGPAITPCFYYGVGGNLVSPTLKKSPPNPVSASSQFTTSARNRRPNGAKFTRPDGTYGNNDCADVTFPTPIPIRPGQ